MCRTSPEPTPSTSADRWKQRSTPSARCWTGRSAECSTARKRRRRLGRPGNRDRPIGGSSRLRGAHPRDGRDDRVAPDVDGPPRRTPAHPSPRRSVGASGSERTSRYLQACWKLSRSYGVANITIVHRLSDLRSQSDDGTTASKVSMGLLADTQTRVLFRQATDQIPEARSLLGLTNTEAALLPRLAKGRALWKIGGRTAVVAHTIGPDELGFCGYRPQ